MYGFGVQGATSLSPNLYLRAGFDYFTYSHNDAIEVTVANGEDEVDAEAELTDTELTFPNFKTFVDYYPMKNGIFCFTGGFYFGTNKASTNGLIKNYQDLTAALGETPELRYEDTEIVITPNDDGSFYGKLDMGNAVKPYFGIGLGRTIPRNRVGFKFELGMVYQGKYVLSSPNLNDGSKNFVSEMTDELDLPVKQGTSKTQGMVERANGTIHDKRLYRKT